MGIRAELLGNEESMRIKNEMSLCGLLIPYQTFTMSELFQLVFIDKNFVQSVQR